MYLFLDYSHVLQEYNLTTFGRYFRTTDLRIVYYRTLMRLPPQKFVGCRVYTAGVKNLKRMVM
jgi:hypothetical protein